MLNRVRDTNVPGAADPADLDIVSFSHLEAVQTVMSVLRRATGLRIVVVAHITEDSWTAAAVLDEANFGIQVGDHLVLETTYCNSAGNNNTPLLINNAATDLRFMNHPARALYGIESYIAVPLHRRDGSYFGRLCALDSNPAELSEDIYDIFNLLAQLISYELEAEEKRQRREQELRSLRDFIAIAAHDLRQPMTSLYGNAQMLARSIKRGIDQEKLAERSEAMVEQISRAIRLSDTLLDMAHAEAGSLNFIPDSFDIVVLAQQALEDTRGSALNHEFSYCGPLELTLRADEQRLGQVVRNLLDNAVKYAPAEAGPISLNIEKRVDDYEPYLAQIIVSVRDHGPGVAEDQLTRLFARRYRVDGENTRRSAGLGLGLFIASQIIEAHSGRIWAETTPGGGLTVSFALPDAS